ncbi:MAG TPA: polysaccharide pyruvyl transferase family protein, partial [Candidatus Nitrosotenuis sp.]|nr:polysaccharide pyruvyl transferase family protein [Candidatus Nitrosotenuis sp.]
MPGPRLLISGYYGFGNTGDEAILQAMVAEIRRQSPQARLAVLTADAQAARSLDLVPLHRRRLSVLVPAIRNCDLVLSGGGGLVQDSTGVGTVAYYLGITTLARLLGRPC